MIGIGNGIPSLQLQAVRMLCTISFFTSCLHKRELASNIDPEMYKIFVFHLKYFVLQGSSYPFFSVLEKLHICIPDQQKKFIHNGHDMKALCSNNEKATLVKIMNQLPSYFPKYYSNQQTQF